MKILGITGKAGSGKDTLAELIELHCIAEGLSMCTVAFGYVLKKSASDFFGVPLHTFYSAKDSINDEFGMTNRRLLQKLGGFGRSINPDYWCNKADPILQSLIDNGTDVIVFTDVRFDNEAQYIIKKGGSILHMLRNETITTNGDGLDVSEEGINLDLVNHSVDNTGTKEDLVAEANKVFDLFIR